MAVRSAFSSGASVGEERQCLVGVGGHDDMVEAATPGGGAHLDAVVVAFDGEHLRLHTHVAQPLGEFVDIGARTTHHGAPGRGSGDLEHAVVIEEGEEVTGGVGRSVVVTAGPDAGDERHGEVLHEVVAVAAVGEELAPGHVAVGLQETPGAAVEAGNLGQHPHEARIEQASGLREDSAETPTARIGEPAVTTDDAHAHLGGPGVDAEGAEEAQQVGIGALVHHDEAAVDPEPIAGVGLHVMGVGMTAQPVVGLEEGHVVATGQQEGRGQAGDTPSDHRCGRST